MYIYIYLSKRFYSRNIFLKSNSLILTIYLTSKENIDFKPWFQLFNHTTDCSKRARVNNAKGEGEKKNWSRNQSRCSPSVTFSIHYTVRERVTTVASERTRLTGRNKFVRLTNRTRRKKRTARRFSIPPAAPAAQSRGIGDELRFEYSFHASRRCSLFHTPCMQARKLTRTAGA